MNPRFVLLRVSVIAILVGAMQEVHGASVTFEAESGALGTDFTNDTDGVVQFISISTDRINNGNPGNINRVATYNNYIGKSQWPDPSFNGLIDEFRIYSVALSPGEIAATFALGANELLSINSPTIYVAPTPTSLVLTWPLAFAGFTLQSRTDLLEGNWVNVTSPAPQIISGQWQVTLPVSVSTSSTFYRLLK